MDLAVIQTGGKQYVVSPGDVISVEKISDDHKAGDAVVFDQVLLTGKGADAVVGTPFIPKAQVKATVIEMGRAPKVLVVKYKQKSRYWKRNGHRQPFLKVKIDSVK